MLHIGGAPGVRHPAATQAQPAERTWPRMANEMETEDTREAPWTVTEFFLDPRRYNPSAPILHTAANVRERWFDI